MFLLYASEAKVLNSYGAFFTNIFQELKSIFKKFAEKKGQNIAVIQFPGFCVCENQKDEKNCTIVQYKNSHRITKMS